MDWSKGNILKKIGLDPKDYVDMQLSIIYNKPMFDLYKFGDWLDKKFNEPDLSIEECVNKHFPEIAKEIKELFTE